jgi:hypothetical protein
MGRYDMFDSMNYWSASIGGVDFGRIGDITVGASFQLKPKPTEIKVNFNFKTTLTTNQDGGTSLSTNKLEEREMYKKEDFYIGTEFRAFVSVSNTNLWLSINGRLEDNQSGDNSHLFFNSTQEAEEALDKFLSNQKGEVKMYLEWSSFDGNLGEVGEPTGFNDLRGDELFIGDTVESFDLDLDKGVSFGEELVCNDGSDCVMGLKGTNFKNGNTKGYAILKTKSYKDLVVGDKVGCVVVKEKEIKEVTMAEIEAKLGYKVKVVK